jgi:hypothetical protein
LLFGEGRDEFGLLMSFEEGGYDLLVLGFVEGAGAVDQITGGFEKFPAVL